MPAEEEKKPEPADAHKNRQHATQENGHPISD